MSYHHLTAEERSHIYELHVHKTSVTEIARLTGRDKATISRELRRNQDQRGYRAGQAERFARGRQRNCANGPRVSSEVWEAAKVKLREDWSPEHISGRFEADGTGQISTQTIYDFVLADWSAPLRNRTLWEAIEDPGGNPMEDQSTQYISSPVASQDGRRRRFSKQQKQKIVEETYQAGMSASLVARKHAISPHRL